MVDLLTDWLTYKDTRVQGYLFTSDINPFTTGTQACKISGLKDALKRLQTVYFPVL